MRRPYLNLSLIMLTYVSVATAAVAAPALWEQLVPRKSVPADPNQEYTLAQSNGPWLVMATSFTGEEGKAQAHELVLELRKKYHVPAYYYGMEFELEDVNPGRGIDQYGAPIKRRYNRGESVVEHAVLVGEFPSIDDPEAQKVLQQIKHIAPEALKIDEGEETAQSMALVREIQNQVRAKVNPNQARGPMGHAFLTRNPMLPKEYFVPQGVDPEVAKWNEPVEYSLMKCPGKYSIRVATFRGRVTFETYNEKQNQKPRKSKKKKMDPLEEAAYNAHAMTVALRAKGWEAYEFHDRHESYVSIGSFDSGQQLADGRIELNDREAQIIANTFGAATPNNVFERPAPQDIQEEELRKQHFNRLFSQGRGEVFEGLHPKRFIGLPLDIIPEPVNVPRKSISGAYARSN
jgi:hypothetical protein